MGVEEAVRAMNVQIITETHCSAGIVTHSQDGHLIPKFWAQSATKRAIAQPATPEGLDLGASVGIVMFGLMMELTDGRWFGRTAEAWVRSFRDGDQFPVEGLASIAETDPEVHTAIVAQGFDMQTSETHTALATFTLDNDGRPLWHRNSERNPGDQFLTLAVAVQQYLSMPRLGYSLEEIDLFVTECGWAMQVFDV